MLLVILALLYTIILRNQQRNRILAQTLDEFTIIQKRSYKANPNETFNVMLYYNLLIIKVVY